MQSIDNCSECAPEDFWRKLKLFLSKDKQKSCIERQNKIRKQVADSMFCKSTFKKVTSVISVDENILKYNKLTEDSDVYNPGWCKDFPNYIDILKNNKWLEKEIIELAKNKQKNLLSYKDIDKLQK